MTDFSSAIRALQSLAQGGAALVVGATDCGKSTFVAQVGQHLAQQNLRVAVVDADIGQAETGTPGTVGVAWADASTNRLHEWKPRARFFVGAFSPAGVALEHTVAVGQAVAWARAKNADRILVNTGGLVSGSPALRLQTAHAALVRPELIIGCARGSELDRLASLLQAATGANFVPVAAPPDLPRKSASVRATRRLTRVSNALQNARELVLALDRVALVGGTLATGDALAPHLALWAANTLRLPIIRAEISEKTLTLFTAKALPRAGWEAQSAPVAAHFGVGTVRVVSLAAYENLFLGLHDETGRLLCVGRFVRLDVERGQLVVSAPPPADVERVRLVVLGRVRVHDDGSFVSEVKPGEL